jgi:hypothetical protein
MQQSRRYDRCCIYLNKLLQAAIYPAGWLDDQPRLDQVSMAHEERSF